MSRRNKHGKHRKHRKPHPPDTPPPWEQPSDRGQLMDFSYKVDQRDDWIPGAVPPDGDQYDDLGYRDMGEGMKVHRDGTMIFGVQDETGKTTFPDYGAERFGVENNDNRGSTWRPSKNDYLVRYQKERESEKRKERVDRERARRKEERKKRGIQNPLLQGDSFYRKDKPLEFGVDHIDYNNDPYYGGGRTRRRRKSRKTKKRKTKKRKTKRRKTTKSRRRRRRRRTRRSK